MVMPVSFGIKTSQMGLSYPDIFRVWPEADGIELAPARWLADEIAAPVAAEVAIG
jgi:hypothetical protein